MITLVVTFIVSHLGALAAIIGGAGAFVATWMHGRSAGIKSQQGAIQAAQAQVAIAQDRASDAQASAKESADAMGAVRVEAGAQQAAASIPDAQLDARLEQLGALRKD